MSIFVSSVARATGLLGFLIYSQPVFASTYLFSVPEGTIESALRVYLNAHANPSSDLNYGFYDIYIRPIQSGDSGANGTALSSYTLNSAGSPIPTNANGDQWDTTVGATAPADSPHLSIRYYFDPNDSKIALITTNPAVTGKTYTNPWNASPVSGERMPGADFFAMTISSADPKIAQAVNFWVGGKAYQFTDSTASALQTKVVYFSGAQFAATGVEAPEPSSLAVALGGVMMLGGVGLWRRRKALHAARSALTAAALMTPAAWGQALVTTQVFQNVQPASYLTIQVTDVPAGHWLANGTYQGWCVDDPHSFLFASPRALELISSSDPAAAARFPWVPWDKVNYILNHRPPGAGPQDVQRAIWEVIEPGNPGDFPLTGLSAQMVAAANASGAGFVPAPGQTVSVILPEDELHDADSIQDVILEATVPMQNHSGPFLTYTQGGWGAAPHGNNPGALLKAFFAKVYPGGFVRIGSGAHVLTFTGAAAIQNFLPQSGTPGVLTSSAVNPTKPDAGVLAGQLLAATLSMDFSTAGITRSGLGELWVTSGALAGFTVRQVIALANAAMAGDYAGMPAGLTLSGLNDVLDRINNNYDNGTRNQGYLK